MNALNNSGYYGVFWSNTVNNGTYTYYLGFNDTFVNPVSLSNRFFGRSVRCLVLIPIPKIKVLSIAHYTSSAEASSIFAL